MAPRSVKWLLLGLVLAVVGCDHATKQVAQKRLGQAGSGSLSVIDGAVDLQYTENRGVAFNAERWLPAPVRTPVVLLGGLIGITVLAWVGLRRRQRPMLEHVAWAVMMGGALGNLLDRAVRGFVVDFIYVHGWPVFNVADVAIVAGALGWLLVTVRTRPAAPAAPG